MNEFFFGILRELVACHTAFVVTGLVGLLVIRRGGTVAVRDRVRTITIVVVLHLVAVFVAGALSSSGAPAARWAHVSALTLGAVALTASAVLATFSAVARLGWVAPPILRDVVSAGALLVTMVIVASNAGIDVTSLVATSAVLTAVIGLSFQDTLGNLMAGLVLQSDSAIRAGDWVRIDTHTGKVIDMRWRYIALRTRNGETVFVPNSKLVKSEVIRIGRVDDGPTQWRRWVYFNVDFRHPPPDITAHIATALAHATIPGVSKSPAATCVLMGFEDSYARYAVRYWLTDLQNDDPTDSLVRSHVYLALKRAGIELSIPAEARFITKETVQRRARKEEADIARRVEALRKVEMFDELSDDERRLLAGSMQYAPFGEGETISRFGNTANWLYLLLEGTASVRAGTGDRPEWELMQLSAGAFFGELSLLTGAPRQETVVAVTDVECYRLGKAAFEELLKRRPELVSRVSEVLAERQRAAHEMRTKLEASASREPLANQQDLYTRIQRFFGL